MRRFRCPRTLFGALLMMTATVGVLPAQQIKEEDRRFKLAQGYEASGDLKSASRVYKELHDLDRKSNAYFDGVRRTYMAMLRYAELLPIVEERLKMDAEDIDLRSLHADLLHRNRRREEALAEWRAALDLRPNDELSYVIVANAQMESRLFDDAVATFRLGRQRLGNPGIFGDQLAQLYGMLGRFEEASVEYVDMLMKNPTRINYVMSGFGMFTTNPAGADAAIRVVKKASDTRPDYLPMLELLEWLYSERGDNAGSFDMAKRLDQLRNGRGSSVYGFADRALREGNIAAAVEAFDYFLATYPKDNPLYTSVLIGYTKALEQRYRQEGNGSKSGAGELADRYRTLTRDFAGTPAAAEALFLLAHLESEDLDEPRDAIESLVRLRTEYPRFPSNGEALLLEGELHLRLGQIDKARETFARGAQAPFTNNPDARRYRELSALRLAETLFFTGNFKAAVDSFTVLTENTGSEATNDALQYLFLLQENFEKNDDALKHYAAGSLSLVQRKWEDAIAEMGRAAATRSSLADEALMGKARAQEKSGQAAAALETLMEIVKSYHDGTVTDRALFRAAELAERVLGDHPKALELYTRLLTEYPASSMTVQARQRIRALRGNS